VKCEAGWLGGRYSIALCEKRSDLERLQFNINRAGCCRPLSQPGQSAACGPLQYDCGRWLMCFRPAQPGLSKSTDDHGSSATATVREAPNAPECPRRTRISDYTITHLFCNGHPRHLISNIPQEKQARGMHEEKMTAARVLAPNIEWEG
jgi:hypothetical protein